MKATQLSGYHYRVVSASNGVVDRRVDGDAAFFIVEDMIRGATVKVGLNCGGGKVRGRGGLR